jgi:replication factor C subunit 3/5|tara:strand:+ start:1473 stop:2642 length:1170 start_codon:yes stop_codon:yes gene_type:complete
MFLVDKYQKDSDYITCHQDIIETLLDTFDSHQKIYKKSNELVKKSKSEFKKIIKELETKSWRYSNLQHLVIYGPKGCGKEYVVDNLLKRIYGNIETTEIEYTINGYSNSKEKVIINQSKYHIIIEPNNNGFDKYLIQEIIQEYAKTENLTIFKYKKLFKVVIINKIDNLSYSAQASLRRTMEKYADTCKFIFICDQLSKIIEPLRSRCLLIRVPLPNDYQIIETLTQISKCENIKLEKEDYKYILDNCESKVNNAIWLLEMKKYNVPNNHSWKLVIDKMVNTLIEIEELNNKTMIDFIKKLREYFYILFITNIDVKKILKNLMICLIEKIDNIKLKHDIIEIISKYELRISQGTRHIVHLEAMMVDILTFLYQSKINILKHDNAIEYVI